MENFTLKKQQLKDTAETYLSSRKEFISRSDMLKESFPISMEDKRYVAFAAIGHADSSLQPYSDILSADEQLAVYSEKMTHSLLEGNLILLDCLIAENAKISGYHLNALHAGPQTHSEEIFHLIQGIGGFRHIHIIKEKIMFEMPARYHIKDKPDILELVDYWLKSLEIFEEDFNPDSDSWN